MSLFPKNFTISPTLSTLAEYAKALRPRNLMEPILSTLSRYSIALVDKTTGEAYSADQLADYVAPSIAAGRELLDPFDGAPVIFDDADAGTPMTATYEADTDKTILLTAKTAGVLSPAPSLVLVDPAAPDVVASLNENPTTRVVTVTLGTGVGDKASSTIPASGDDMVMSVSTPGEAGNNVVVDCVLPTNATPFGDLGIEPSYAAATCSVLGDGYIVLLPTDAGTAGVLTLTESSASAGELTITQAADKVGAWGNNKVHAVVDVATEPASTSVSATITDGELTIAITLGVDAGLDVIPISDDALAALIETALETVDGETDLTDYFVVASATAGNFDTAAPVASMSGGVDPALDATPIAVADFQLLLTGAVGSDLEVTTVGTGNYVPAVATHAFTGGGANAAITTDLDALATLLEDSDIIGGVVGSGDGATLCTDSTTTLTGGTNADPEHLGTPARLGRIATDGTDVWTAMKDDLTGTDSTTWVKTFTGTP